MKRSLGLILVIALILTSVLAFTTTAYAEDHMNASVKVSKSSLPGPGTVELTFTITNDGDPVRNVRVKYPDSDQVVELGDIPTGGTETHEDPNWEITESMLDEPLAFEVFWESENGSENSGFAPAVTITRSATDVSIEAEARVDKTHVEEGEKVQFTFTFENKGNVDVTDAYLVAEPLNSGEPLGDNFSVKPGETNTKTWSPTINQEITVKPVYTYTVNGTEQTLECNPVTVRIGDSGPELKIDVSANVGRVAPGGEVEFQVGIENTGTMEVDDISVRDSQGGSVQLSQTSLQPGASATGTETVTLNETTSFVFSVSGASQGEAVTAESSPIDITVDPALGTPAPAESIDANHVVQIDVTVVTQVQRAGVVPVEVMVHNLSADVLTNIVVSADMSAASGTSAVGDAATTASPLEASASAAGLQTVTIGTLQQLEAGQSESIAGTLDIQQTSNCVFRVSAEMPDGTLVTSETNSTQIELRQSGSLQMWQWIVIIAVAVAVIVAVVLILRSRKHVKKAPKRAMTQKPQRPAGYSSTGSSMATQKYRETSAASKPRATQSAEPEAKPAHAKAAKQAPPAPKKAPAKQKAQPTQQRYADRNKF